jgi:hypothetical protein
MHENKVVIDMRTLFLTSISALLLATGMARAAGIDYVCGQYTIVVKPEDRTITVHDWNIQPGTETVYTETVPKGITSFGDNDKFWTVKTLPRNKRGKVAVHGIPCQKIRG